MSYFVKCRLVSCYLFRKTDLHYFKNQMIEEQEYRQAYQTFNPHPCAFAKALLSGRCGCQQFQRLNIAEREAAACQLPAAQVVCEALRNILQEKSQFALKTAHLEQPLPHAKAMKVQCGGLIGLQAILQQEEFQQYTIEDIYTLVQAALKVYESWDQLPFVEIIKYITTYQVRTRR